MAYETDASVGTLIRGALDDARELFREEVALAKAEIRQEAGKLSSAGIQFGIAGAALWFTAMFLLIAAALGIAAVLEWAPWTGFAIVAVVMGIVGIVTLSTARAAARRVEPLPRTVATVKENFR